MEAGGEGECWQLDIDVSSPLQKHQAEPDGRMLYVVGFDGSARTLNMNADIPQSKQQYKE